MVKGVWKNRTILHLFWEHITLPSFTRSQPIEIDISLPICP